MLVNIRKFSHKLSLTLATQIRARSAAGGVIYEQLAAEYGVGTHTIANVVRRTIYKNVP